MKIILKSILVAIFFSSCNNSSTPKKVELELYAEVPYAVGNIAYDHTGQLVFSNHPFYSPKFRVMTYDEKTKTATPFPNEEWNTPKPDANKYLVTVLGIHNDSHGVVWMLDMGRKDSISAKFVGWDTKSNTLKGIYPIPAPASIESSQLNDFIIDEKHEVFIIADENIGTGGDGSKGALVVVDMKTGKARRLLEGHTSTIPEETPLIFDGKSLNIPNTQTPIYVGADGITADKDNEWLYYAPLNGTKLYRIKITDLLNEKLTDVDLGKKVELYSEKENNGGLSIDIKENIYTTYIESNSIGVITPDSKKSYHFASNENLYWPDGVSYNKDGYMYVSAAQLQLASVFNNGVDKTIKPFKIFRFKPIAEGIIGR